MGGKCDNGTDILNVDRDSGGVMAVAATLAKGED